MSDTLNVEVHGVCNETTHRTRVKGVAPKPQSDEEDEDDNYAEINVIADHDYYYITNLNDYYYQQQQEQQKQQQIQTQLQQSNSSAALCAIAADQGVCSNGMVRKENGFLTQRQHQQQQHQQQYESLKGTLLRNTKKCRRKIVSLNFLMKNLIMYRLKYDIL
uniref:Uncharacterized protein n=1 Tax=Bactrocera dorsalis TaxID=27457 RepID=A0A034VBI8_BACDO